MPGKSSGILRWMISGNPLSLTMVIISTYKQLLRILALFLDISGRKRNGTAPSHYCRANRSIQRKVLQGLESLKIVEKDPSG